MTESQADNTELDNQEPWGGVTDPLSHDPNAFRYLIHLDSGVPDEDESKEPSEYLLKNPAGIKAVQKLSTSLVDPQHRMLWQGTPSRHGFILEVPTSGIIATNPHDMNTSKKTDAELSEKYPPQNPDDLLAATLVTDHNEVLVSTDSLQIKAVFWVDSDTDDWVPFNRQEVEAMAAQAGLPFLELELEKL